METTHMSKANTLVIQGLCGYAIGLAITSGLMLESGELLFWLLIGFLPSGFLYGLSFFFVSDEPHPYYRYENFAWMFVSFLLKLASAYLIGLIVYPVVLVITLIKASQERKDANRNGANYGSPFQFFQLDLRIYTARDCSKATLKYIIFLIIFIVCFVLSYLVLKESHYRGYGIPGVFASAGYIFTALVLFYRMLHDSWGKIDRFAGILFHLGVGIVYTCIVIDIGCIMFIAMEKVLDLERWRILDIQKIKLFGSVGITFGVFILLYLTAQLIYCRLRFKQLKREEAKARQRYIEELMREETEEERLDRLEKEIILRAKQRQSWEKMKKQRQLAEQRKKQNSTDVQI